MKYVFALLSFLIMSGGFAQAQTSNPGECVQISSFGGGGDGITDNSAPLNSALASLSGIGGCISFGPGTFLFGSQVSFSYVSNKFHVGLKGAGRDATILRWNIANGGLAFNFVSNFDSLSISEMSLYTSLASGGTAIGVMNATAIPNYNQCAVNDFHDLAIGGIVPNGTDYWTNGIFLTSINCVNFYGVSINGPYTLAGIGIALQGYNVQGMTSAPTTSGGNTLQFASLPPGIVAGMFVYDNTTPGALSGQTISAINGNTVTLSANAGGAIGKCDTIIFTDAGIVYNISASNFFSLDQGLYLGTGVQGITVTGGSNFTGGNFGIVGGANSPGQVQLTVTDSQFNNYKSQILTMTPFADMIVRNNEIFNLDTSGANPALNIEIERGTIEGNHFVNLTSPIGSSVGISMKGVEGIISGNLFGSFSRGIVLNSGANGINVQSNVYAGVSTAVSNSGSNNAIGSATQ